MECTACNYVKDYETNKKGEDFIRINGSFTVDSEMNYGANIKRVTLLACPHCKTMILED